MDKLEEGVKKVALGMNHKSFSGEVTYDVPCFDEYLIRVRKIQPNNASVVSESFSLDWATASFEIKLTDVGDQAEVYIRLYNLEFGSSGFCEYFWELCRTFSILEDNQKLFNISRNKQGKANDSSRFLRTIETWSRFSISEYLAAAKTCGKANTFRISLKYQALGCKQLVPVYNKTPEYPVGISGKPALMEALHRGAESDFIISCQGQDYPVHRIVLKWASPVLRQMLETPMQEASSNKLVISDVDSKTVQMMIDFIYKGRIDVVLENDAVSLLYCAEKYELVALKEHCLQHMKSIVSDTNVIEFLSSAIKCNAGAVVKELVGWCKKRFWELSQKDEFRAYVEANLEVFYGEK